VDSELSSPLNGATGNEASPFSGVRHDRPRRREGNTETEQTILDAAEALLSRDGFGQLKVARIIDESGLSRATFYHYFSSRLSVIAGLLDRVMNELLDVASPFLLRPSLSVRDSVSRSIETAVAVWTAHRPLLHAVMETWTSDSELERRWAAAMERFAGAVALEVDECRSTGRIPQGPPSLALANVLVWSTERTLHIAGRGTAAELPDENAAIGPLVQVWCGTLGIDVEQSP